MFLTTAPLFGFFPGAAPRPIDKTLYIAQCEANKHRARFISNNLSKFIYREISAMRYRENDEKICNSD